MEVVVRTCFVMSTCKSWAFISSSTCQYVKSINTRIKKNVSNDRNFIFKWSTQITHWSECPGYATQLNYQTKRQIANQVYKRISGRKRRWKNCNDNES